LIVQTIATTQVADDVLVIDVCGELDLHSTPRLRHEIAAAFAAGAEHLIVDLTACEFLESTALETLLDARRRLGLVSLVISDRSLLKIFEIAGCKGFFTIYSTLDGPLAAPVRKIRKQTWAEKSIGESSAMRVVAGDPLSP
jgi:anti-sigma B factor antagonist